MHVREGCWRGQPVRPACWTERSSPGYGCGGFTPEMSCFSVSSLHRASHPAPTCVVRGWGQGPGTGQRPSVSGPHPAVWPSAYRSTSSGRVSYELGPGPAPGLGWGRGGHARRRAWLMSILWTETPRHQAPTCPPRPSLLPESLSQGSRDPGLPGPCPGLCKATLSLLICSFRQTSPNALLSVSLDGCQLRAPFSLGDLPAPLPAPHPHLTAHRAMSLPCPTPLRTASVPSCCTLGFQGSARGHWAGDRVCASLALAPSPAHCGAPIKARTTASNKADVVTAQEGQMAGPLPCAAPSCGGRVRSTPRAELLGGAQVLAAKEAAESRAVPLDSWMALGEAGPGPALPGSCRILLISGNLVRSCIFWETSLPQGHQNILPEALFICLPCLDLLGVGAVRGVGVRQVMLQHPQ